MSHLRDIINEERDNITDDIRDAVDNITPKYVLRITSHIDPSGSTFNKTVALDTPEREIFKRGETTTDTGWRTQREERRKARI